MKDLQIDFVVTTYTTPIEKTLRGKKRTIRGEVECTIHLPGEALSGSGYAYCSASDTWDENEGRKTALARAVKVASRAFRRRVWNSAFELGRVGR